MHFIYRDEGNNPITEVFVSKDKKDVRVKNYAEWPLDNAFGVKPIEKVTWGDVYRFITRRTFSANRINIGEILHNAGLKEYDPVKLCASHEGRNSRDQNWIEFLED